VQEAKRRVRFSIEKKPAWKYKELLEESFLFSDFFEVPKAPWKPVKGAVLPSEWQRIKKKVFHLIRQIYGQMKEDSLRFGVIQPYEMWWFCSEMTRERCSFPRVSVTRPLSPLCCRRCEL
jgi:hypothetical protein